MEKKCIVEAQTILLKHLTNLTEDWKQQIKDLQTIPDVIKYCEEGTEYRISEARRRDHELYYSFAIPYVSTRKEIQWTSI